MADNPFALQAGTILVSEKRNYKVVKVLGSGGFGVTYLAKGKIKVDNVWVEGFFAIKELFPSDFSHRADCRILPNQGHEEKFRKAKSDFLLEASRLQSIGTLHDNIVKVNEVFEANGTAYYVMQYVNGHTLYDYVNQYGGLQFDYAFKLIAPIMQAVEFLHQSRINHFDIKPDNVMLQMADDEIQPVLIDFGLSTHFRNDGKKTTARAFGGVSEGYAPLEQYADINHFSPPTDVYALAATIVFMLTGTQPTPAPTLRIPQLRELLLAKVPENVADALCHAMLPIEQRTPTVGQFRDEITGAVPPPSFAPQQQPQPQPQVLSQPQPVNYPGQQPTYQAQPTWQQPAADVNPTMQQNADPYVNPTFRQPPTANPPINDASRAACENQRKVADSGKKIGIAPWIWGVVGGVVIAVVVLLFYSDVIKFGSSSDSDKDDYLRELEAIAQGGASSSEEIDPENPPTDVPSLAPPEGESYPDVEDAGTSESTASSEAASSTGAASSNGGGGSTGSASSTAATPPASPARTNGSVAWNGNGTYTGQLLGGKPDGRGKIKFTADGVVDRRISNPVSAGYLLEGTFSEGKLLNGILYDEAGNRIASIIP